MSTKTKILHLIDSMNWGGAETLVLNTVELLKANGSYENHIGTFSGGPLEGKAILTADYHSQGGDDKNIYEKLRWCRRLIRAISPDIVHSHLLPSTILARLSIPISSKLVSTYHSKLHCRENEHFSYKQLWADKLTYRARFFTIYVSDAVKNCVADAIGIKSNQIVLPNFAHESFTPNHRPKRNGKLKLVSIGRLTPQKNFSLAIRAISAIGDDRVSLDIYGSGPLAEVLSNEISHTGASVNLLGNQPISNDILCRYDAFLLTSTHEGMPIALIEAMRSGLPSILSNLPELVETAGDSAVYFDANDETQLIEKIRLLGSDPNHLPELRNKVEKWAERYSPTGYFRQLDDLYQNKIMTNA